MAKFGLPYLNCHSHFRLTALLCTVSVRSSYVKLCLKHKDFVDSFIGRTLPDMRELNSGKLTETITINTVFLCRDVIL